MAKFIIGGLTHDVGEVNFLTLEAAWPAIGAWSKEAGTVPACRAAVRALAAVKLSAVALEVPDPAAIEREAQQLLGTLRSREVRPFLKEFGTFLRENDVIGDPEAKPEGEGAGAAAP